ncbi:amidohydrolase family protein [Sphingomonas sp. LHG3406-1]|uniref:amidohydrolase family protein n=1 Tax=Sphingomonas sp. LHG3406-1 TaxID=2804617 RepID=UPI00345D38F7
MRATLVRHLGDGRSREGPARLSSSNAADLLGLASEVGSIEPGSGADIIAVAGSPPRRRLDAQEGGLRHGPRRGGADALTG